MSKNDDESMSTISDLDIQNHGIPLMRQYANGSNPYHDYSPPLSPVNSNSEFMPNSPRRERKSDYGMFDKYFEDDVLNWFNFIDNKKKAKLITILAESMCYPNLFGYLNDKNIEHRSTNLVGPLNDKNIDHRSKPVDLSNPPIRNPFRLGRQSKEYNEQEQTPLLERYLK